MALGKDEKKHISCNYLGRENDCPNSCSKCAIAIKTDGDLALSKNKISEAIRQYKKAIFVEPSFAEAWCNLGNAYGMKSEYHNAINAFNKAIAIDPVYGKALFGKAITLKNLGETDKSMALCNEILEIYNDDQVLNFKKRLTDAGVKDLSNIITLEKAIDMLTNEAYEVAKKNQWLGENGEVNTIKEIYQKEDFTSSMYSYCSRRYASLGIQTVWSEAILAAFYGSVCATLLYFEDKNCYEGVTPFDYLSNHINLEELDKNAEKLLNIKSDENTKEKIWNIIYSYVKFCIGVIGKVEPKEMAKDAVIDAAESAYVLGMLLSMKHIEQQNRSQSRDALDIALKKLAESSKDYTYTRPSAMCYSIKTPPVVDTDFTCDHCGKRAKLSVYTYSDEDKLILTGYPKIAAEFTQSGYPASVKYYCDDCATKLYPKGRDYHTHNIVFAVIKPGCSEPVYSYPSPSGYNDFPYRVALAFIKGADTISTLAEATNTHLEASRYLEEINNVLGMQINDKK